MIGFQVQKCSLCYSLNPNSSQNKLTLSQTSMELVFSCKKTLSVDEGIPAHGAIVFSSRLYRFVPNAPPTVSVVVENRVHYFTFGGLAPKRSVSGRRCTLWLDWSSISAWPLISGNPYFALTNFNSFWEPAKLVSFVFLAAHQMLARAWHQQFLPFKEVKQRLMGIMVHETLTSILNDIDLRVWDPWISYNAGLNQDCALLCLTGPPAPLSSHLGLDPVEPFPHFFSSSFYSFICSQTSLPNMQTTLPFSHTDMAGWGLYLVYWKWTHLLCNVFFTAHWSVDLCSSGPLFIFLPSFLLFYFCKCFFHCMKGVSPWACPYV